MGRVGLVDYGMCNLDSVKRALEECGAEVRVASSPAGLEKVHRVVLPGVGAFSEAMANLRDRGFDRALADLVHGDGVPLLGICLGMQLLATTGHEGGETAGLGWIDGDVVRLEPTDLDRRVPHIGWNELNPQGHDDLFEGVPSGADVYFVHSYHLACRDEADVAATTPYCGGFVSAVRRGNVAGFQFHPEKSQRHGLQLLSRFLAA